MKKLIVTASAALLLSNAVFATSMNSLNSSQVKDQFNNKTITTISLVTLDGSLVNNTFTGYFDASGKLEGRMTNKPDNGPLTDAGKWNVKPNGSVCVTWQHWSNAKTTCVAVYKLNNGLLLVNDDTHKLETIILSNNIKTGNQIG